VLVPASGLLGHSSILGPTLTLICMASNHYFLFLWIISFSFRTPFGVLLIQLCPISHPLTTVVGTCEPLRQMSSLLSDSQSTPDDTPLTEVIKVLQVEFNEPCQHILEYASVRKAGEDPWTIKDSMRKFKGREKGNAELVESMEQECVSYVLLLLDLIE
jgi:hypothetical protein